MWLLYLFILVLTNGMDVPSARAVLASVPGVSPFVSLQNALLAGEIAYTDPSLMHVYVDFERLKNTPNTRNNIIKHELGHTRGGKHGDGSLGMSYFVRTMPDGSIINDEFLI